MADFVLAAANGDRIEGFCSTSTPFQVFRDCTLKKGTGRFAGATGLFATVVDGREVASGFKFINPTEMDVTLVFILPQPFLAYFSSGLLDASESTVQDGSCASGLRARIDMSGPLPDFGQTTGTISYCAPK
jgi:hypothetical protein